MNMFIIFLELLLTFIFTKINQNEGMKGDNDYNSLWTIKQGQDQPVKLYSK